MFKKLKGFKVLNFYSKDETKPNKQQFLKALQSNSEDINTYNSSDYDSIDNELVVQVPSWDINNPVFNIDNIIIKHNTNDAHTWNRLSSMTYGQIRHINIRRDVELSDSEYIEIINPTLGTQIIINSHNISEYLTTEYVFKENIDGLIYNKTTKDLFFGYNSYTNGMLRKYGSEKNIAYKIGHTYEYIPINELYLLSEPINIIYKHELNSEFNKLHKNMTGCKLIIYNNEIISKCVSEDIILKMFDQFSEGKIIIYSEYGIDEYYCSNFKYRFIDTVTKCTEDMFCYITENTLYDKNKVFTKETIVNKSIRILNKSVLDDIIKTKKWLLPKSTNLTI